MSHNVGGNRHVVLGTEKMHFVAKSSQADGGLEQIFFSAAPQVKAFMNQSDLHRLSAERFFMAPNRASCMGKYFGLQESMPS